MSENHDDAATDLLIKEVDEELRQERMAEIWKKYANLFIGAAVAVVLAVTGWQAWRAWEGKQRQESSRSYAEASRLAEQGKPEEAAETLAKLADGGASGYRVLADFKRAAVRQSGGDDAGAARLYRSIAESRGIDAIYHDLAVLKAAYLDIDGGDAALIEKQVEPLTQESSPWRHSAREVTALAALKRGDTAKAIEIFKKLADDIAAPQGVRTRAAEMLAAQQPKAKG